MLGLHDQDLDVLRTRRFVVVVVVGRIRRVRRLGTLLVVGILETVHFGRVVEERIERGLHVALM